MTRPALAVLSFSPAMVGGMRDQAEALVRELRRDGYQVTVVPFDAPFPAPLQGLRRRPVVRTLLNLLFYLRSLRILKYADVVHVFSAQYWSFVLGPVPAILQARRLGKRIVVHYHSGLAADHLAHWGWLVHPWLRMADEIVVPSESLRSVFARHGHRARVIPNIVDTARFAYRERTTLQPRLLSTRNLEPYYGVDTTIEAFRLLKQEYPDATLTIIGSGSEETRLRRIAASMDAEGIRFVGRVDRSRMPVCYDAADIFVNASIVDAQPVSVLEAFAAGVPVVSTGTGDIGAMLRNGKTGITIPPGDPSAMAQAVAGLLQNPTNAVLLARHAKRELQSYTWPRVREAWAGVYSGLPCSLEPDIAIRNTPTDIDVAVGQA